MYLVPKRKRECKREREKEEERENVCMSVCTMYVCVKNIERLCVYVLSMREREI